MGKRILLIDESAMLRRIAASVLGAPPSRHEVLAATRATEGFARACSSGVDLILADQRLSNLPGDDLSRRLLAEPRTARVPVVLLIGRGIALPPLETLPVNVIEVLGKPFAPEQLVALVNTILECKRTGATLPELRARLHPKPQDLPADPPFRAAVQEPVPAWGARPHLPGVHSPVAKPAQAPAEEVRNNLLFRRDAGVASLRATFLQVAREGLSGVLRLRPPEGSPVEVFTDGGRVVVVTTRGAGVYSEGAVDILPAKVSPATLEAAVHEQARGGIPFFLSLGTHGLLSKAAAETLLHRFGQRLFARLWAIRPSALSYEFEAMDALPGFAMRLTPRRETVDEWLLETLRALEVSDLAGLGRHEGFVGVPYPRQGGASVLQKLSLTAAERDFAARVNGRNDLPTLSKQLNLTLEATFLMVHRFRCLEAMDYRSAPAAFVVTPRTSLRRVLPLKR